MFRLVLNIYFIKDDDNNEVGNYKILNYEVGLKSEQLCSKYVIGCFLQITFDDNDLNNVYVLFFYLWQIIHFTLFYILSYITKHKKLLANLC